MSVHVIHHVPSKPRDWPVTTMLVALLIVVSVTMWTFTASGPGGPPSAIAGVPPLTVAQGQVAIKLHFGPSSLKGCARVSDGWVRCQGYGSWVAPRRWVYLMARRDSAGNLYFAAPTA